MYSCAKVGRPTYIQQLCEDTGCNPEDLPEAMNDREKWRERVRDIRAGGVTWWWWWYIGKLELNPTVWKCTNIKTTRSSEDDFIFPTLKVSIFKFKSKPSSGDVNFKYKEKWASFKHFISIHNVLLQNFFMQLVIENLFKKCYVFH